jgi:antitoxin FitA
MSKMIQVRDVPDRLHRELVRRAKRRRQTLTDYIQELLEREVRVPLAEDIFARIEAAEPVDLRGTAASLIAEERRGRSAS